MGKFFRQQLDKANKPPSAAPGGKRAGAGRKPTGGVGTVITTVRLTPEQQLHFAALGGSAWLREQLQALIDSMKK